MQIDGMKVAIRPMSTAQAVDLGFMMARHWFVPLWQIWVAMALPVFVVVYVGLIIFSGFPLDIDGSGNITWFSLGSIGSIVFWWLKPIYEKPMVNWLGQALFDDSLHQMPNALSFAKQGWKTAHHHAGKLLFRYRLSMQRQLMLPVLQLEQIDSQAEPKNFFKSRLRLLRRGQSSGVSWHTLIMVHLELAISIGGAIILYSIIPTGVVDSDTFLGLFEGSPRVFELLWALIYFFTISLVAPFFICGGFAIYLTKRCLLESWDIELVFKQLQHRYLSAQNNPMTQLKKQSRSHPQSSSAQPLLQEENSSHRRDGDG